MFIFDIFKGGNITSKVESESASESKILKNKYLSAENDIKYMEEKYDDYVYKSLELEYPLYKDYVDNNYPSMPNRPLTWAITELKMDRATMQKGEKNDNLVLNISYSFHDGVLDLNSIFVQINYNSVLMKSIKFEDVITNYILYWKLREIETSRKTKKESFQKMVNIIGKDVKRDALIEQILS